MKVKAKTSVTLTEMMDRMSQADVVYYYFGITGVPCLINSPLRDDKNPSFSMWSPDGQAILWKDFATGESGDAWTMMQKYFKISFNRAVKKAYKDGIRNTTQKGMVKRSVSSCRVKITRADTDIHFRVRSWKDYDDEYWTSFGISRKWLEYVGVYPIDYKIVYKNGERFVFKAEKYAYAFLEHKEGVYTTKIYQPFSKKFKWANKNDASVVGLWTKIPKEGDRLCICSSLKDALCFWANTNVPCIYVQSESTGMSETAQRVLKERYKHIYVIFDNDKAGLKYGVHFAEKTGFKNIVLPEFEGGKDISDLYKVMKDKEKFKQLMLKLLDGK